MTVWAVLEEKHYPVPLTVWQLCFLLCWLGDLLLACPSQLPSMGCPCSSMGLCSSCHAAPLLLLHQHSCTWHLLQTRLLGSCIKLFLLFHSFLKQNPTFHSGVGVTWRFPWGQEEEMEGGMMAGAAEGEAGFGCLCGECYDCEAAWEFQTSLEAVSHQGCELRQDP